MIGMIGQQTVEHMRASLAVDALEMARQPTTQQASHCDRTEKMRGSPLHESG